jgi:hypothetical protein
MKYTPVEQFGSFFVKREDMYGEYPYPPLSKLRGEKMNLQITPNLEKEYAKGSYNKFDNKEQWIRITEGCPNACPFCRETIENGREPFYLPIPEIVRNDVKIMDMNLIAKPKALEIILDLGLRKVNNKVVYYELVCGIDYRFMNQELANTLKQSRFKKIRLAWDFSFGLQKDIKKVVQMFLNAGYRPNEITIFMICNWLTSYEDNLRKLDLCKVWNVKVADCYFDNQLSPNIKPLHWTVEQIKDFRKRVRKHNQLVNFKIDPEYKKEVKK